MTSGLLALMALYFQQQSIHARRMNGTVGRRVSDGEAIHGLISLACLIAAIAVWIF